MSFLGGIIRPKMKSLRRRRKVKGISQKELDEKGKSRKKEGTGRIFRLEIKRSNRKKDCTKTRECDILFRGLRE